ncbi:MAG: ArnT family glycosyltransferase [Flavipsychrobacter sp.]
MPNAIDTFYSRGHPLLFYAAAAAWMRVFGSSHISQHAFSLFVSVLLIISVYEVCNRLFNKRVAILAVLILCVQTMFFVQASFVLPEVMVALLVLLTLYFYIRLNHLFAFLSCTALLFTKESGMVLGLMLGMHALFNFFDKKQLLKVRVKQFLSIFLAGITIIFFFLIQKKLNGWYLYPEHTGMISFDWGTFFGKVRGCLEVVYFWDNRSTLFLLLLVLSLAVSISYRSIKYAAPVFPGAIIYTIFENTFPAIPEKLLFTFLLAGFLLGCYFFITADERNTAIQRKFIGLSFAFLVLYLCFSSINFMSPRYSIVSLVISIVLTAYYADFLINKFYSNLYYGFTSCAVLIGLYGITHDSGLGDTDTGAFDAMKVQEDAVRYLEKKNTYDDEVTCGAFQDAEHLRQPLTGFLQGSKVFKNVKGNIDSATKYVLIDNIEPASFNGQMKNDTAFKMVYRTEQRDAWAEIYERK